MRQPQVLFLHCFLRPFMSVLVLKGGDRKTGFYVQEISRGNTCEGRWAESGGQLGGTSDSCRFDPYGGEKGGQKVEQKSLRLRFRSKKATRPVGETSCQDCLSEQSGDLRANGDGCQNTAAGASLKPERCIFMATTKGLGACLSWSSRLKGTKVSALST